MLYADRPEPLSRVYKIGAWFNSENFADQQYDNTGLSLADPASNGLPRGHHGNYGFYATADQMVWMDPAESDHNVNVFGRILWAPQADRNFITFSMNAGITVHEPFPHRDGDTFAIGMGFAKVSNAAAGLDRATAAFTGAFTPTRSSETYLEVSYQYQVAPWWQLQPDMQYVFNPGGGVANPDHPSKRVGNEFILGLRTNILF
jgi:porin